MDKTDTNLSMALRVPSLYAEGWGEVFADVPMSQGLASELTEAQASALEENPEGVILLDELKWRTALAVLEALGQVPERAPRKAGGPATGFNQGMVEEWRRSKGAFYLPL